MIVKKKNPYCFLISKDGIIYSGSNNPFLYESELLKLKEAIDKTINIYHKENLNDKIIDEINIKELEKENKKYKKINDKKETFIYLMHDENTGYYKIGRSVNPVKRERTLQSEKPTISLIYYSKSTPTQNTEYILHQRYKDVRVRGEWFALDKIDVMQIKSYLNLEYKKYERRISK